MKKDNSHLPRVAFSILLALSLKERHGYGIIKQIEEDSQGKIKIGPGALYTSIRQLRETGLIKEVDAPKDSTRRYYKLTSIGIKQLNAELAYYQNALQLAKRRHVLNAI